MLIKESEAISILKNIVENMREEYEKGNYFNPIIGELIEDAYVTLGLNYTFNSEELKKLKKANFKVNSKHNKAERTYRKIPLTILKDDRNSYILKFGNIKDAYFVDLYDINEASGRKLKKFYQDYINYINNKNN